MALLETEEARTFLPQITGLINCPVIVNIGGKVQAVGKGFHSESGLFVTDAGPPEVIELSKAKNALQELAAEFDFLSPGDRSRALASFIAPALKLGGHLRDNVPADVAEADRSQAGKTYRQKLVAAIYNERPSLVTLTLAERENISRGIACGSSIREIAKTLQRAVSTVSREVARHGGRPLGLP